MDIIDKKLVYLLGKHARLSNTSLAKCVRTSRELVTFRLKRLKEKGIITGSTVNINYHMLGMNHFQILLKLRGCLETQLEKLEKYFLGSCLITSVQRTFGHWDYVLMTRARKIEELATMLDEIHSCFPEIVESREYYVLDEHGPGWRMVLDGEIPEPPLDKAAFTEYFRNRIPKGQVTLDKVDELILQILGENCRTGILEIAQKAGISYRTAIQRIKKMIQEGVIDSFDGQGSLTPLGFSQRTIMLCFENINKNEKKVRTFFNNLKACSRYWRLLGPVQFRVNLYTKTTEDFEKIVTKIRTTFGDDLLEIESMDILAQKKMIGFTKPLK